jgi:hypothetical protein
MGQMDTAPSLCADHGVGGLSPAELDAVTQRWAVTVSPKVERKNDGALYSPLAGRARRTALGIPDGAAAATVTDRGVRQRLQL